jgi:hypothetical protein
MDPSWTGRLNRYRTKEKRTVTDCVINLDRRVAIGPIKTQESSGHGPRGRQGKGPALGQLRFLIGYALEIYVSYGFKVY